MNNINQLPDPNPMPEFHLLPERVRSFGHRILSALSPLPSEPLASHGDHFVKDRGAEAMLDAHLEYEQLEIDYDSKC